MRAAILLLITALATSNVRAASPDEYLDTTFGDGGIVTFAGQRSARPALQLADGSLIVVTEATDVLETVSITKLDRNGAFDRSFGQNGTVRADPTSSYTSVQAVFDGGNGRVVLSGLLQPLNRLYLKRLNPDGTPDATFGNARVLMNRDGRANPTLGNPGVLDFGYTGSTVGPPANSCYYDSAIGYHATTDGGALVVVSRGLQDCFGFLRTVATYLVRIKPSGELDDSYGRTSLDFVPFGSFRGPTGTYGSRLLSDGTLELWSTSGKARVAVDGRSVAYTGAALAADFPSTVFWQPDGSWIVQGLALGATPPPFEVRRFDGQPDALFGNAGRPVEFQGFSAYLNMALRTTDGGVVGAAGYYVEEPLRLCIWRASGRMESCGNFLDWRGNERGPAMVAAGGMVYLARTRTLPRDASLVRLNVATPNVEYFNSRLGHYFVTYEGSEARAIDAGMAGPGWSRTGVNGFKTGGTTPVCRFYGTPGIGSDSHFFTISAEECELVKKDPGWMFEGYGFYATPVVNGQCEAPLVPVHRLYNNRAAQRDSNHRHVTSLSLISPMVLAGWSYEGVAFCARP